MENVVITWVRRNCEFRLKETNQLIARICNLLSFNNCLYGKYYYFFTDEGQYILHYDDIQKAIDKLNQNELFNPDNVAIPYHSLKLPP